MRCQNASDFIIEEKKRQCLVNVLESEQRICTYESILFESKKKVEAYLHRVCTT
jgi:hypothetical protein